MHLSRSPAIALFAFVVLIIAGFFALPGIDTAMHGSYTDAALQLAWMFCLLGGLTSLTFFLVTFIMDGFRMVEHQADSGLIEFEEERRMREPAIPQRIERRAS